VRGTAVRLELDLGSMLTVANNANCPYFTTEFLYDDGSGLTGDPFSEVVGTSFTTEGTTLVIESSDSSKVGVHDLKVSVYLTGYPLYFRSNYVRFSVEIVTCAFGTASYIPPYFYDREISDT